MCFLKKLISIALVSLFSVASIAHAQSCEDVLVRLGVADDLADYSCDVMATEHKQPAFINGVQALATLPPRTQGTCTGSMSPQAAEFQSFTLLDQDRDLGLHLQSTTRLVAAGLSPDRAAYESFTLLVNSINPAPLAACVETRVQSGQNACNAAVRCFCGMLPSDAGCAGR